jgi:hypothetical protein
VVLLFSGVAAEDRSSKPVNKELKELKDKIESARQLSRKMLADRLKELKRNQDELSVQMDNLAGEFRQLQGNISDKGKEVGKKNQLIKGDVDKLQEKHEDLARRLDRVIRKLEDYSSVQDLKTKEGRNRAELGDQGRKMLRRLTAAAKKELDKGGETNDVSEQKKALGEAAEKEGEVAKWLDDLAKHFKAHKEGRHGEVVKISKEIRGNTDPDIRARLEGRYNRLEQLYNLADMAPEQIRDWLANVELPGNPGMREGVDDRTDGIINDTKENLDEIQPRQPKGGTRVEYDDEAAYSYFWALREHPQHGEEAKAYLALLKKELLKDGKTEGDIKKLQEEAGDEPEKNQP